MAIVSPQPPQPNERDWSYADIRRLPVSGAMGLWDEGGTTVDRPRRTPGEMAGTRPCDGTALSQLMALPGRTVTVIRMPDPTDVIGLGRNLDPVRRSMATCAPGRPANVRPKRERGLGQRFLRLIGGAR